MNTKKKRGRPTIYKPEYCDLLREHMRKGYSFESFGATVGISRDRISDWANKIREFSDAKKMACDESLLFWEKIAMAGMTGKIKGFNQVVWIFSMKNRFGWKNQEDITVKAELSHDKLLKYIEED